MGKNSQRDMGAAFFCHGSVLLGWAWYDLRQEGALVKGGRTSSVVFCSRNRCRKECHI